MHIQEIPPQMVVTTAGQTVIHGEKFMGKDIVMEEDLTITAHLLLQRVQRCHITIALPGNVNVILAI